MLGLRRKHEGKGHLEKSILRDENNVKMAQDARSH
jgi:hypothetical protein